MKREYKRIFVLNEPNSLRINSTLACEIGLNESIVLLQIEYWISISENWQKGRKWTYQSIRDMKRKAFNFWSTSTINRAIKNLINNEYIIEGNFNKKKYDKTRWFSLNYEKLNQLESISVGGHDTRSNQNETGSTQNDTRSNQNETTIPETTTEITTETKKETLDISKKGTYVLKEEKELKAVENITEYSSLDKDSLEFLNSFPRTDVNKDEFFSVYRDIRKSVSKEELIRIKDRYIECKKLKGENRYHKPTNFFRNGEYSLYLDNQWENTLEICKKVAKINERKRYFRQNSNEPKVTDEWNEQLKDLGID